MASNSSDVSLCVSSNPANGVELIDLDESLRTQNIIKSAVKILEDYCRTQQTNLCVLEKKTAQHLCRFLQKFYTEVRQVSGKLYARKSMITLRYGLQRHFKRVARLDIITDDAFIEANEVFSVILMKLRAMGKDAIKRKNPITEEDILKIMSSSALDQDKPRGLQNKVFMDLMLHMCSRGRDNLREISKRDFRIETSHQGFQYISFRIGADQSSSGDPTNEVHMYEIPGCKWCPLKSFKKYSGLLNPLCDAFWQRSKQNVSADEVPWYDNMPIGKNTLGTRMKEISREAGCSQIYTNHCLRTTQISTLKIYTMDLPQQLSGILRQAGPSNQVFSGKPENPRRKKIAAATVSSATVLIPDDSPPQPSPAKVQKKQIDDRRFEEQRFQEQQRFQERRFDARRFEERRQMVSAQVSQMAAAKALQAQLPIQQHMNVSQASQIISRPVQVLPPPVQISEPKPKPVEKPRPREKRIFVVSDHQRCVMSNLASLWKSGKLCDAGIGNGSSTVMVHKVVLSAVCPKLLSVFSTDILSHKFLQVNFPEEVSTEALNAFAEYMYNGLLDIDPDILHQLKIIAKRLDMKEFEQLCDSRLPSTVAHIPTSTVTTVFGDLTQMRNNLTVPASITVPTIQPSLPSSSTVSVTSQSAATAAAATSITTQVIDVKQEISEAELAQVKKDTAAVFGQESEVASLDVSKSGNSSGGFVIVPSVKTEPVGPEDDRYGQQNNQSYTSSAPSISRTSGPSLNSTVVSTSDFILPFSNTTDSSNTSTNVLPGTSKLKSNVFESSLVSDLSPVSCIVEKMCSQSSPIHEDPSKSLNRTLPTQSLDNIATSGGSVYPIGLFTAGGDSLPLTSSQVSNVKNIALYKTDDLT